MSPAPAPRELVCVATVATAHGVRGALKLRAWTEEPASVAAYGPVYDAEGRELFRLEVIGEARQGVIAKASGITSRDAAEALRGVDLYVPRNRLPPTGEDEFYQEDLIGLEAVDSGGTVRGRVAAVYNHGAGDVLEIQPAHGTATLVLPFTREAVPAVDIAGGRLVIEPPVEHVWEGAEE
jgi:16S rRNA processing protein RimM